ncbi:hypothetical protein HDE_12846 [Halotydeus destructor]|nr:hypothetical protein HDE_12846 [Halotydeus destructor]
MHSKSVQLLFCVICTFYLIVYFHTCGYFEDHCMCLEGRHAEKELVKHREKFPAMSTCTKFDSYAQASKIFRPEYEPSKVVKVTLYEGDKMVAPTRYQVHLSRYVYAGSYACYRVTISQADDIKTCGYDRTTPKSLESCLALEHARPMFKVELAESLLEPDRDTYFIGHSSRSRTFSASDLLRMLPISSSFKKSGVTVAKLAYQHSFIYLPNTEKEKWRNYHLGNVSSQQDCQDDCLVTELTKVFPVLPAFVTAFNASDKRQELPYLTKTQARHLDRVNKSCDKQCPPESVSNLFLLDLICLNHGNRNLTFVITCDNILVTRIETWYGFPLGMLVAKTALHFLVVSLVYVVIATKTYRKVYALLQRRLIFIYYFYRDISAIFRV